MKFLKAILMAAAVMSLPASANAAVLFNVSGVFTGPGGGTLTGTFSTNDARTVLETVNLTSTAFNTTTNYTSVGSSTLSILPIFLQLDLASPFKELRVLFSPTLSPSGATIGAGSYEAQGNLNNFRALSGSVTAVAPTAAVPEPSTWAMMLAGFGMVGFGLRNRRKQTVRVAYA